MIFNTPSFKNSYDRYGNVAYVKGWYRAECFVSPAMRIAQEPGREIKFRNKPDWFLPAIQLDFRKAERLNMNESLEYCLIMKGKFYPKIFPATALDLEKIARKSIKRDWRVEIIGVFESLTYQRQGWKKWILVEIGKGAA